MDNKALIKEIEERVKKLRKPRSNEWGEDVIATYYNEALKDVLAKLNQIKEK